MALIATIGGSSSDSYSTLAEFQSYASMMGWTLTATDAVQETYLRRATLYLNRHYTWKGIKDTDAQAMQWPRVLSELVDGYAVSSETIPQAIKDAQNELAWLLHGSVDLFATVDNGAVKSKTEEVDVISVSTEYVGARELPSFTVIEGLVAPYSAGLRSGGFGSIPMGRS